MSTTDNHATTEDLDAAVEHAHAAIRAVLVKEERDITAAGEEYANELREMFTHEDEVTKELVSGIVEHMCLLCLRYNIPYVRVFPRLAVGLIMNKWEPNAKALTEFIADGRAKELLDERYENAKNVPAPA